LVVNDKLQRPALLPKFGAKIIVNRDDSLSPLPSLRNIFPLTIKWLDTVQKIKIISDLCKDLV
jgi:hypothetical protein